MFPELVGLDGIEEIGPDLMAEVTGAYYEIGEDMEAGQKFCPAPHWPLRREQIEDLDRIFWDFCNGGYADG